MELFMCACLEQVHSQPLSDAKCCSETVLCHTFSFAQPLKTGEMLCSSWAEIQKSLKEQALRQRVPGAAVKIGSYVCFSTPQVAPHWSHLSVWYGKGDDSELSLNPCLPCLSFSSVPVSLLGRDPMPVSVKITRATGGTRPLSAFPGAGKSSVDQVEKPLLCWHD